MTALKEERDARQAQHEAMMTALKTQQAALDLQRRALETLIERTSPV